MTTPPVPDLVAQSARIMLRPLGNPLPLGFLALAVATLLLSARQLNWIDSSERSSVALILLAFVAPLQLLASILGFLARDVVAGTAMAVLSGTWLSVALVTLASPRLTNDALGIFLLAIAGAMLIPAAAAISGKLVPAAVLATTALRFLATGIYELNGDDGWRIAAGIIGLALAAIAAYAALALTLEDARRGTVLPLGRRGPGRESLTRDFQAQLGRIEREAGIREQL